LPHERKITVILAVAHTAFVEGGWLLLTERLKRGAGIVLDVKSKRDRAAQPGCIDLWRL
jgi:UDP-N-acetyl-D-glucosamine/UDP-N-acetyl-D-galactosamine dehydrogenase